MVSSSSEKYLARIISIGTPFVTIFLLTNSVSDPVNAPKLLSLGVIASAALGALVVMGLRGNFKKSPVLWIFTVLFIISSFISLLFSDSPFSQGIYGSYGRNNGFLTYTFLSLLLLTTSALSSYESLQGIAKGLFIAGYVNIVYCLWVILFGDFIPWSNPYGNILGTLGNPNFIGSFLGIFLSTYLAYGISSKASKKFKLSMILVLPITAFEIFDSSAIQGRVVGLSGVAIVLGFYIRSKFSSIVTLIYAVVVASTGLVAMLGALQIGPLSSLIYKTSVSLRGQYWLAGWNTGTANPFFGTGMDAFGDWYRRSRDSHALELPGVNVVVNAAHNVPLDMFAFGGWPLFVCYLAIMTLGAWSVARTLVRVKTYEPIFVVLVTAWFGYQLQSIISINQIGLAIWGWVLTGALVAYERLTRPSSSVPGSKDFKQNSTQSNQTVQLRLIISIPAFALVGLLVALPPLSSDAKWRKSQILRTVESLESTMQIGYFNPPNTQKYFLNIQNLEQSNLPELAHKYALQAVKWNPDAFDLWKILYYLQKSTPSEKRLALINMRRLDPLNQDVTAP